MNERIKQLERQAIIDVLNGNDPDGDVDRMYISAEFTKKFAELIVRECAEICLEMSAKCAGLEGDGALAKDCAYWIKKDFGVEE
jgi:hypothetical protein